MAMIDENGVVLRNIQEQVQKNKYDILELKQAGEGHEPIPGPMGPTGPQGAQGPEGERGLSIYGTASTLPSPSAYKDGDFFLLNNGSIYKKVNGSWLAQTSLRGPQGVQGEPGSEVTPNPTGSPQDELTSIEIDGVRYRVKGDPQWGDITGEISDQEDLSARLTSIAEIAEGKNKSYLLSVLEQEPDEESFLVNSYVDHDGDPITDLATFHSYVGSREFGNADFDQNESVIDLVDKYIIVKKDNLRWVLIYDDSFLPLKDGDVIFTEQVNIPDYWFYAATEFYILESRKIDLTNVAKTNQTNTFTVDQRFNNRSYIGASNVFNIRENSGYLAFSYNDINMFMFDSSVAFSRGLRPVANNIYDIGASSLKYKDLYLSGTSTQNIVAITNSSGTFKIQGNDANDCILFINRYNGIAGKIAYNGGFEFTKPIKIGNTTLTEDQLIALLELIS